MFAQAYKPPSIFIDIFGKSLVFFLFGAFWSLVGLAFATGTDSKYMAYGSPFIIYYVLIILAERYFKNFALLNPKQWISPTEVWPGGSWGLALLMLELIVLVGLVFSFLCKRRLSSE